MKGFALLLGSIWLFSGRLAAQTDSISFSLVSEFEYTGAFSAYTAQFDRQGRPYIFTASQELGLVVFDIANPQNPIAVDTLPVQAFNNLKPTNLCQQGSNLYVSLGGFEGIFKQKAGLAILNASDPKNLIISAIWDSVAFNKGSTAVQVEDGFAYLGAMEKGLIILKVSNPAHIHFVSNIVPDLNWPAPPGIFNVPHVRGLALRDSRVYVCYDAGGLRVIDVSDKKNPVETARYLMPGLLAKAQPAYNNVALAGNYAFVTLDYCGLEVIDLQDPAQPKPVEWLNPWNCTPTSWDGNPGHTNQLITARHDSLLFVSGADTEILVYDISSPAQPKALGQFGLLQDSIVSWGIDVSGNQIVTACVDNPFGIPYDSDYGGIRLFEWSFPNKVPAHDRPGAPFELQFGPNPFDARLSVSFPLPQPSPLSVEVFDLIGNRIYMSEMQNMEAGWQQIDVVFPDVPAGPYLFSIKTPTKNKRFWAIKQ